MRNQAPRAYWISMGIFAVAVILFIWAAIAGASGFTEDMKKAKAEESAAARDISVPTKSSTADVPRSSSDPSTSAPAPVNNTEAAPQASTGAEVPIQPERIPFTSKPVTPGNPESYEGTYGQCPFYENAMGGKGCQVPPGLTCNADWSYCEPTTTNTNQEDAQNGTIETLRAAEPSPATKTNQSL